MASALVVYQSFDICVHFIMQLLMIQIHPYLKVLEFEVEYGTLTH